MKPPSDPGPRVLIRYDITCMACPLAIEGVYREWADYGERVHTFYFRARHDRWRLNSPWPHDVEGLNAPIAQGEGDDWTIGEAIDIITEHMRAYALAAERANPVGHG